MLGVWCRVKPGGAPRAPSPSGALRVVSWSLKVGRGAPPRTWDRGRRCRIARPWVSCFAVCLVGGRSVLGFDVWEEMLVVIAGACVAVGLPWWRRVVRGSRRSVGARVVVSSGFEEMLVIGAGSCVAVGLASGQGLAWGRCRSVRRAVELRLGRASSLICFRVVPVVVACGPLYGDG